MEMYVLKSALCLFCFYAFYKGVLESTSLHRFKRGYLILALLLSFGIPLLTITTYVEANPTADPNVSILSGMTVSEERSLNYIPIILWSIYSLGALFFGIRFVKNLSSMVRKIVRNPKERSHNIIKVFLTEHIVPHTFFSFIFLNRQRYELNEIPNEVLDHERTHARELHTLDVILAELICVLFWFNPAVHFVKRAIKLNHEFLADRSVLNKGIDRTNYQKILLAYSSSANPPHLANSINYSSFKKRFTVMKSKTSKRAIWLRTMLILPLMALVLFSFTNREYIPIETDDLQQEEIIQTSATRAEMKEYTKLARKYNNMSKDNMFIQKKDVKRMEYIYQKMSPKQRADAEPFPKLPTPPPPPPAPDAPKAVSPNSQVPNPPQPPQPDGVKNSQVPPPPPPPTFEVSELISQGATFYLNDKKISNAKAKELEKNLDALKTINVKKGKDGKLKVYFVD